MVPRSGNQAIPGKVISALLLIFTAYENEAKLVKLFLLKNLLRWIPPLF